MGSAYAISENIADAIRALVQLDYDAVQAYGQAINGIEPEHMEIKEQLISYRADHERHIQDLTQLLVSYGYERPALSRDVKGVLLEGMTAVRAALGTAQALKAMRQNEQLTNQRYDAALALDAPIEVLATIGRNRDDERRHLDFLERVLSTRAWDVPAVSP